MPPDRPTAPRLPAVATAPRRARLPRAGLLVLGALVLAYMGLLAWNGWQLAQFGASGATTADLAQRLLVLPGLSLPLAAEAAVTAGMFVLLVASLTLLPGALRGPRVAPISPVARSTAPASALPAADGSALRKRGIPPPEPPVVPAGQTAPARQPSALPSPRRGGAGGEVGKVGSFTPRVFISHASADNVFGHELVRRLREALDDEESVWYDSQGGLWAGDEWWKRILKELDERNVFIMILSPDSMASKWCQDELTLAWQDKNAKDPARHKVIVPLMYRTCEVPRYLRTVQFADFTHPERFDEDVEQLVRVIRAGRTIEAAPTVESGPPLDLALLPVPTHFVGREHELAWLRERLTARGSATGIAAVNGIGGIGKTGLAAKVIHELRAEGRFPDGIAVVLCQGKTTPDDATQILIDVLTRFDPQRRAPEATDLAGLAEAAQRLLAGKDTLVVLDNVEPELPIERVVAPLREAGATLLLTARQVLPAEAVPPEGRLPLDLLSEREALDLLARSLGVPAALDLPHPKYVAIERIVKALGRHTLAVTLAGAYVAEVGRDLERLADELEDPQRALKLPKGDAPDAVKRVFASSYEALTSEAQRLFVALAAFPTVEFGRDAAIALAGALELSDPEANVDLLARRALATAEEGERLRLHPLIQALAAAEFAMWPEEQRTSLHRAIADYYADYANESSWSAKALDEANIAGALEWAHAQQIGELVVAICFGMQYFWRDTGRTRASLGYLPWGVAAAEAALGDPLAEDSTQEDTASWQDRADTLFQLLLNDGYAFYMTGKLDEAVRRYRLCLSMARQAQNRRDEGAALDVLGRIAQARGRLDEAETYLTESLAIDREVQDRQGEGVDLYELALIAEARGDLDRAEEMHRQSLAISIEVQSGYDIAQSYAYLGELLITKRDKREEGCQMLSEAARLYDEMGVPGSEDARQTARRLGCED